MSKRGHYSLEEKCQVVSEVMDDDRHSVNSTAKKHYLSRKAISDWIRKYNDGGLEGLKESKTLKRYDHILKQEAVSVVINKKMSIFFHAIAFFQISSTSVLRGWISRYTIGETVKSTSKGSTQTMKKGRKLTIKSVSRSLNIQIANELNYAQAIGKCDVSFQQVYSWVKKFQQHGDEALKDNRGRNRSGEFLTEDERLKLRVKELESRNRHLEMENDLAKKIYKRFNDETDPHISEKR